MSEKMKDSGVDWIGEIPEGWETSEIQYKFEQVKRKNIGNQEKNLLSLSYGKIIQKDIEKSMGLLPESFETYNIIENGDIVFRLTDLQNDQRSLRVGLAKEKGIITSAYQTIRPKNSGEIDSRYFFYLFYDYDIQKVFYGMGAGVRQGLTFEELKRLKIIVPKSLSEQKTIADHLDKQTSKFDQAQKLLKDEIERLRAYKKSLIYETVTKGLDKNVQLKDSGVDWIGEIPVGWEVVSLKNIVQIKNGREIEKSVNKGYPVYGSGGVFKYTDKYLYDGESVLLGRKGTIDNPQYVTGKFWTVDTSYYTISSGRLCTKLFYYQSLLFDYQFFQTGSTLPSMTQKDLGLIKLPFPENLLKQEKLVEYLDRKIDIIDKIIKIKGEQFTNLSEQCKTLIYEVVTGKRKVK
ncbi:restriction endonuclease subunit S [Lactococcus petauri]|uniref:Type I restriction modification DNA specificity domain-containing protein n=1 Tax=Lactococcus petauri TaxID=1940789 RepID=A0A252CCD4_9LACT|nr:restriction endonuclease subunit S [Lactococcus petauri]OUK04185.1 hypothetical protein BZZ03_06830 [Lactococcus petauri]